MYRKKVDKRIYDSVQVAGLPKDSQFVGAGMALYTTVNWTSATCRTEYGYYKPQDETTAEELLSEIRGALKQFMPDLS